MDSVVNRNDYIESLQKEVSCNDLYQETVSDRTEDIQRKVKRVVNRMHKEGIISSELKQYLIPRHFQAGKHKGNSKLHKPNAPFRTVVDSKGSPTEKLAEVAENELNDFVETSPSFVRDTPDFIRKLKEIKEPLPDNSILFCFDVVKLYPSVPREEKLKACEEAFLVRLKPFIAAEWVMEMIRTVLDNNNFVLGEKNYIQTDGVAIG